MAEGSGERSWWQTLPGMLTAAATLITALTGLVVAIHEIFPRGSSSEKSSGTAVQDGGGGPPATTEPDGKVSTAGRVRVTMPSGRRAQIGESRYDVLRASAQAGNPGELQLSFRVRLTSEGPYGANFFSSSFRLAAGADISGPTNFVDDIVPGGTTKVEPIEFTLPASTRRATLLVGDDPAKAVHLPVRLTRKR